MKTSEGNVYGSGANVLNERRREALLERDLDLREGRVVLRQVWADIFPNSADRKLPSNVPEALSYRITCRFSGRQHAASLRKEREPDLVQLYASGGADKELCAEVSLESSNGCGQR